MTSSKTAVTPRLACAASTRISNHAKMGMIHRDSIIRVVVAVALLAGAAGAGPVTIHLESHAVANNQRWTGRFEIDDCTKSTVLSGSSSAGIRCSSLANATDDSALAIAIAKAARGKVGVFAHFEGVVDKSSENEGEWTMGIGSARAEVSVTADVVLTADNSVVLSDGLVYVAQVTIEGTSEAGATGEGVSEHFDIMHFNAAFLVAVESQVARSSVSGGNNTDASGTYIDEEFLPVFNLTGVESGDTVRITLEASAQVSGALGSASHATGESEVDFGNTMSWLGGTFYDDNGNELTGISLIDDDGHDWMKPLPVAGDLNEDGRVNLFDFFTFAQCHGQSVAAPSGSCSEQSAGASDLDGNGGIDLNDFMTFVQIFGP